MPGLIVKRDGRPQPLEAVRHTWFRPKKKAPEEVMPFS